MRSTTGNCFQHLPWCQCRELNRLLVRTLSMEWNKCGFDSQIKQNMSIYFQHIYDIIMRVPQLMCLKRTLCTKPCSIRDRRITMQWTRSACQVYRCSIKSWPNLLSPGAQDVQSESSNLQTRRTIMGSNPKLGKVYYTTMMLCTVGGTPERIGSIWSAVRLRVVVSLW